MQDGRDEVAHERRSARRLDGLIAAGLLVLGQAEVSLRGTLGDAAAARLLWAAAAVAVLWRRSHPLLFFAWALVVSTCSIGFDLAPVAGAIGALYMPLALYGLGAYATTATRATTVAAAGLVALVALRTGLDLAGLLQDRSADQQLRELGIFAPAAAGGVLLRDRTELLAAARRRSAAATAAIRDGGGAVELALSAERTRIARELHAVVTGRVRAVLDEVAAARSTLALANGTAGSALRRARGASQQAMEEMRRMLVLLRSSEAAARPDAADVPGSLRELNARGAGTVDVRRAHAGAPFADAPLPAVAMRVLVALAELPGCTRIGVERGDGVVRASARLVRGIDPAAVEALAERTRLAGGRLRRDRLRRATLTVVLPAATHGPLAPACRHAWLRVPPLLRGQGLPLLMLALEVGEALLSHGKPAADYGTATTPVRVAGAFALALAFVPRRRWPLLSVLAVLAVVLTRSVVLEDAFGLNPPLYVAAFVAGAYVRPLWLAALAGVATVATGMLTVLLLFDWNWELYPPSILLFFATMTFAAWGTGVGGRRRLAEVEELRALSAAEERRQARTIARVVEAERLRVARELHDLVGHGLTSITLQCAVAAQLLELRPAAAAAAIAAVEEVGEEVLRELHQLLAALDGGGSGQL